MAFQVTDGDFPTVCPGCFVCLISVVSIFEKPAFWRPGFIQDLPDL